MFHSPSHQTVFDGKATTWIDDLTPDIMPYYLKDNAGQVVATLSHNKQEMLANSPWKFLQNYYTLGQEHNHFKHAMKSTVRLQVQYSNFLGMHSLSVSQGCWFSDTPNVASTNQVIASGHAFHPYRRWSQYHKRMVPCSKWYPFAFRMIGAKAYFIDEDGILSKSTDLDISSIQRFGHDGAILKTDSNSSIGSSTYMILPNKDQISMLERQYNRGLFGWCFSLFEEDTSPNEVKPLNWAKNEDPMTHKQFCRYYKLKSKEATQPYEAMQVSIGPGVNYDKRKESFGLGVEVLHGMSGGPVVSTLLPPNVLAGIGTSSFHRRYRDPQQEGHYYGVMQGMHSLINKSLHNVKRTARPF